MSEKQHNDKPVREPHDPSPKNIGEYLLASLNPVEQFQIARAAAKDPNFFKKHPEDALMPMVLTDYAALKGADAAKKVTEDIVHLGKDGLHLTKHGLDQLRDDGKLGLDVLTLDFPDAVKDAKSAAKDMVNLFKDEYQALKDVAHIAAPLVTRKLKAAKDVAEAGWQITKDEFNSVKDGAHVAGDTVKMARDYSKTSLDLLTLDFPDAFKDGKKALSHAGDAIKHEASSVEHGVVDPVKHAISGAFHAITDLI